MLAGPRGRSDGILKQTGSGRVKMMVNDAERCEESGSILHFFPLTVREKPLQLVPDLLISNYATKVVFFLIVVKEHHWETLQQDSLLDDDLLIQSGSQ